MKIKKFVALALSAVMAVSVLTACGGGSSTSGSLSNNQVNGLLEEVGSDLKVVNDSALNNAVRSAAATISSTGSTSSVESSIRNAMGWTIGDTLGSITDALKDWINSNSLLGIDLSYGTVTVIQENRLDSNTSAGGIWGSLGSNKDKISRLEPINTPEKFAAAMVLAEDSKNNWVATATNNLVRFTYNVSATKAKASDGTVYWVFATQVNAHAL